MVRFQVDIQIIASRVCKQTYVQHTPHVPLHMKCILDWIYVWYKFALYILSVGQQQILMEKDTVIIYVVKKLIHSQTKHLCMHNFYTFCQNVVLFIYGDFGTLA